MRSRASSRNVNVRRCGAGRVPACTPHAERAQPGVRALGIAARPERGEEHRRAREPPQLHGRHGAAAGGLREDLRGVHDLAGERHARHPRELDPLDVADDPDERRHGSWPPGPASRTCG